MRFEINDTFWLTSKPMPTTAVLPSDLIVNDTNCTLHSRKYFSTV